MQPVLGWNLPWLNEQWELLIQSAWQFLSFYHLFANKTAFSHTLLPSALTPSLSWFFLWEPRTSDQLNTKEHWTIINFTLETCSHWPIRGFWVSYWPMRSSDTRQDAEEKLFTMRALGRVATDRSWQWQCPGRGYLALPAFSVKWKHGTWWSLSHTTTWVRWRKI